MDELKMMKEELQMKNEQLNEKEWETTLLKEEIERMKKKLMLTTSSLEEMLDR